MKRNEKNYWNWAAIVLFVYFAFLAIVRAHELYSEQLRLNPDAPASVNALWYLLFFLLGLAAALAFAWWKVSKANEKDSKETLKTAKDKGILSGSALAGGVAAMLIGYVSIGTMPEIRFFEPADPVALAPETETEQTEEQSHPFPIPELPPVKPVDNLIGQAAGAVTVGDAQTLTGWQSTDQANTSVILAQDLSSLTLLQPSISKTGGQDDPANALNFGLNAALLVQPGGTVNMLGGSIQTAASGAPAAAVNGLNASLTMSDALLQTSQDDSPLVFAGFQGQTHLRQSQLYSSGPASAAMLVRSGSSITADNVIAQTSGHDSPIALAAGTLSATGLNANALGSSLMVLRPGSEVSLSASDVSGNAGGAQGSVQGMFVFDAADTAKTDPARLSLTSTEVTFNPGSANQATAPLFALQNCPALITLSGNVLTTPSGVLLQAASSRATVVLDGQSVYGRMLADGGSVMEITLSNGSNLAGSINADNACPQASLSLDASSRLTLTSDMYLSAFSNADPSNSNIAPSGFHIYVNGQPVVG